MSDENQKDIQEYRINQYYKNEYTEESFSENQKTIDREHEIGVINDDAYIALKKDKSIILGNSYSNQETMTKDKQVKVATELVEICNRKSIDLDDLLVNAKKFNQQLSYLSDSSVLFQDSNKGIGNFTVNGTVIVKAWDINLNRYVLIRRKIRTPMFSQTLNYPNIPEAYDMDLSNVNKLDTNLAGLIKTQRDILNKVTNEMEEAEGGTQYDQGNYDSYEFGTSAPTADSNTSNSTQTPSASQEEPATIINTNKGDSFYCWPCPKATTVTAKIGDGRNHDGWDISTSDADIKNIEICASRSGKVAVVLQDNTPGSGWGGFGACVVVDHGDNIKTLYAHLKKNSAIVSVGQEVAQGQKLGIMGNTGRSTATHLHFSIYMYDDKGNKVSFLNPGKYLSSMS